MRDYKTLLQDALAANFNGKAEEFFAGLSDEERHVFETAFSLNIKQIAEAMTPVMEAIQNACAEMAKAFVQFANSPEFRRVLDQVRKIEKAKLN